MFGNPIGNPIRIIRKCPGYDMKVHPDIQAPSYPLSTTASIYTDTRNLRIGKADQHSGGIIDGKGEKQRTSYLYVSLAI